MGLAVIGQAFVVASSYFLPWSERIWTIRSLEPWERAGILTEGFGEDATEFVKLLRTSSPDNASVIIPTDAPGRLRFPHQMQYFLFPRTVRGCTESDFSACLSQSDLDQTYIVAVRNHPAPGLIPEGHLLISFDSRLGFFTPFPAK